jgi:hypothetical protein
MARKLITCTFVAVLVAGLALVAYSLWTGPQSEDDKKDQAQRGGGKQFADVLPAETIACVRLRGGVETLKDRLILPAYLKNAENIRKQRDSAYAALLENAGELNPFVLSTPSCKKYISSLKSVHLAVLPPTGPDEESVWFVEMANGKVVQDFIKEMGDKLKEKRLEGGKVYELNTPAPKGRAERGLPFKRLVDEIDKGTLPPEKKQASPTFAVLEDGVLAYGPEAAIQRVLKTKADGKAASLGRSKPYQTAERDWAAAGELFFFVGLDGVRAATLSGPRDGKESKAIPFAEFGFVAGSAGTDGSLNVRVYAADGKKLPEFMVRKPAAKRFLSRVPGDAALVAAWSYDGSKNARKSLSGWLKEEVKKGDAGGLFSDPVSKLIAHNLDQLEEEVVVMVNDL